MLLTYLQALGLFPDNISAANSRWPLCRQLGSEPHFQKTFLEQAGQISGHQALGSTSLAPHPEGRGMEDASHLPSAPGSLPCPLSLPWARVAQERTAPVSSL